MSTSLTSIRLMPNVGGSFSSHPSKRTRHAHRMSKVDEIDESKYSDSNEGAHPDQVSTSASENSDTSMNSQPPLLDFIGTACTASTWFTSCFPCAVIDINHCDDQVVSKLNRSNAMNVMYGVHEEPPQTVRVPNSFELVHGEVDGEEETDGIAPEQHREDVHEEDSEADQPEIDRFAPATQCQETKEQSPAVHEDTQLPPPTRKRFNIRPKKPTGVRKLFKRKQQQ